MSLPAFLTRRREDTPMPETASGARDDIVMRFLTQGGAVVEVRTCRFRTRYTVKGRPYISDEYREVNGSNWRCLGCGKQGDAAGYSYQAEPYLPDEADKARDDANGHAAGCRAMPKPTAV